MLEYFLLVDSLHYLLKILWFFAVVPKVNPNTHNVLGFFFPLKLVHAPSFFFFFNFLKSPLPASDFPGGSVSKESTCNVGDWVWSLGWEGPLEKEMAISSILAWRIPGTEEPGGLLSVGRQSVWRDWATQRAQRGVTIYGWCPKVLITQETFPVCLSSQQYPCLTFFP